MARPFNPGNNAVPLEDLSTDELVDKFKSIQSMQSGSQTANGAYNLGKRLLSDGRMMSSTRVTEGKRPGEVINYDGVDESWKSEAFYYYEYARPEVKKIVDLTARSVAACELQVGWQRPEGTMQAIENDAELNMLLREFEGPGGNYHQIMHDIAANLQVTGDGFLIGKPIKENGSIVGYEDWEFVSVDEISVEAKSTRNGKSRKIYRDATGGVSKFSFQTHDDLARQHLEDYFIARGWRRNLRYSQLSTSALKANLKTCKLLTKLEDLINAIADSQLPAGILVVPEEASLGPVEATSDGSDPVDTNIDSLTEDLIDFMALAVDDRSSSASLAPILLRIKGEYADKVKLVRLARDLDAQTSVIRQELYERLAIGLDSPPEALQGKSNVNNWTGYQIDAEFASKHVIPLGHMIGDFITRNYVWPMLRHRIETGRSTKTMEEVKRYRFIFNPRNIVARIDRATLAIRLFELGELSGESLIKACGFEVTDAPSANERLQATILDLFKGSPKTLAPLLLPLINGLEGVADQLEEALDEEESETPDRGPNDDDDARGNGPRRTPDESRGTEPNRDRINRDRGPGGEDQDRRPIPDEVSAITRVPTYQAFISALQAMLAVDSPQTLGAVQNLVHGFFMEHRVTSGLNAYEVEEMAMRFAEMATSSTATIDDVSIENMLGKSVSSEIPSLV